MQVKGHLSICVQMVSLVVVFLSLPMFWYFILFRKFQICPIFAGRGISLFISFVFRHFFDIYFLGLTFWCSGDYRFFAFSFGLSPSIFIMSGPVGTGSTSVCSPLTISINA